MLLYSECKDDQNLFEEIIENVTANLNEHAFKYPDYYCNNSKLIQAY